MRRSWLAWFGRSLALGATACSPTAPLDAADAHDAASTDGRDAAALTDTASRPDVASPPDAGAPDAVADASTDATPADAGPRYRRLPCNVSVGTGSGTLTVTSVGNPGDVICVRAGTTATIVDNIGCDDSDPAGDTDGVRFFGPIAGTVVQSGNHKTASCAGLTDPITGLPL